MNARNVDTKRKKRRKDEVDPDWGLTRAEIEAFDAFQRQHPELMPTVEEFEGLGRLAVNSKARLKP
jgi:hypothetical protein